MKALHSKGGSPLSCFKAYDVRGKLGVELDEAIAWRIGRAYAEYLKPRTIVLGSDVRLTSAPLKTALANGLMDAGVDVIDIGCVGTEEVYFAVSHLGVDGGIEVTASHNPIEYNGMKFVGKNARPIGSDTGLHDIKALAEKSRFSHCDQRGELSRHSTLDDYIRCLMGFVNTESFRPLKLVVNSGNGAAGHIVDAMERYFLKNSVPITFVKIHHEPDGRFPNGIPNPLVLENRSVTADAVIAHSADMGIAWDGDFDRCFMFDETGKFIEGYYITGILAEAFLRKHPGEKIIHDPRLTWNTVDVVYRNGGTPIQSRTGHAFIKERMRRENAIYGGEMSAHHYFRDFSYCDSGMIPWLIVAELISKKGAPLSSFVDDGEEAYPCSGEINYRVGNPTEVIDKIEVHFRKLSPQIDRTDGLSLEFSDWRMNLRTSNTEPLLRLNVESRGKKKLVAQRVSEIEQLIRT